MTASRTEKKTLVLNLFEMNTVSHISHGLWSLPGNNRHRFNEIGYWTELAQLLEAGGFDGVFLADVVGAYDVFRGGPETAVREGLQIPSNDPLLVIPLMAAVTERLGFGVTFSTSYEPPFSFARRMSTLDHLTRGRVGWNIVTSYLPNAARNFGLEGEIPHDRRYEIADEFCDVVYKLWEGSWDDDAVVVDRESRVYTDPSGVRYVDHVGETLPGRRAAPHPAVPAAHARALPGHRLAGRASSSPAATPSSSSPGGRTAEDFRRNVATMQDAAVRHGRSADDLKFVVQAGVVVGRTEEEAADRWRTYQERTSIDGILAHASLPVDLTAYPRDITVAEAVRRSGVPESDVPSCP